MAIQKVIDDEILEHHRRSARIKYRNLLGVLDDKSRSAETGVESLSELVRDTSILFSGSLHLVQEQFKKDSDLNSISGRDDLLTLYSAYVASRVASQNADRSKEENEANSLVQGKKKINKILVERGKTEFSTVRMALEGLVDYLAESKSPLFQSMIDYFAEYGNQVNTELINALDKETYKKIKEIQWTIGPYNVDGLYAIVVADNGNITANIQTREKQQFHTPLRHLSIPKDKVLRKDRIVGDQEIITYLERMVKCLFLYNPNVDRNPMRNARIFQNTVLLQGLSGTGKGAVSFYAINFAEKLNEKVGGNLLVTKFDIDSSYVDGRIQKLKSQFDQISSQKKIFLIYQDEIDGMLFERQSANKDSSNMDVVQEFNKFLDGEYPNKGNYLLIGSINDIENLRVTHQRRFNVLNWQGAVSEEQKSALFEYKLEDGIRQGYVSISKDELNQLGKLSVIYGLSGADITIICERTCAEAFSWDKLGEVYELRESYEQQVTHIPKLYQQVKYNSLVSQVEAFVEHRKKANDQSRIFRKNVR